MSIRFLDMRVLFVIKNIWISENIKIEFFRSAPASGRGSIRTATPRTETAAHALIARAFSLNNRHARFSRAFLEKLDAVANPVSARRWTGAPLLQSLRALAANPGTRVSLNS